MRIAQVAPLTEAVPPKLYGGTERVVHWLTEELVALGNDVTLFASGDSQTSGKPQPHHNAKAENSQRNGQRLAGTRGARGRVAIGIQIVFAVSSHAAPKPCVKVRCNVNS